MARTTTPKANAKSSPARRKPGRPVGAKKSGTGAAKLVPAGQAAQRLKSGRPAKVPAPSAQPKLASSRARQQTPTVSSPPKLSKDDLRAEVGRLERLVARERAKSRAANKAARAAAARIEELEAQVARLEKRFAAAPASMPQRASAKPARKKRPTSDIDPGDAVPPGVAVQEPEALDAEAAAALENLGEHLGHD